jgi:predicted DNA-binding transcriptional regulator YafY
MTASALAAALEVSERTIYRDVDALSAAGVPIYGVPGPEGGYALLDRYRTQLTGLTEGEIRALFMLSIPAPLADLGLQNALRSALLKLTAALPEGRRVEEQRVRQRFYLDPRWWQRHEQPLPALEAVQEAIWQDRLLRIAYQHPIGLRLTQVVEPYGLVAKAGQWYLVYRYQGRLRVLRVAYLVAATIGDEAFVRAPDFDLATFWAAWCAGAEKARRAYRVTVRVAPDYAPMLPQAFGLSPEEVTPPDETGWVTVEIAFDSLETARDRLLGHGHVLEVLEPAALRKTLLDFARHVVARDGEEVVS